jgi:hypothetical protein
VSIAARQHLVTCGDIVFAKGTTHCADLLDPTKTNTYLIGALIYAVTYEIIIQPTAIYSDHHDDSALNPDDPRHSGTHRGGVEADGSPTGGFAIDCWFLASRTPCDWLDPSDPRFAHALRILARAPDLHQIGLAGAARTDENLAAAGPTVFVDGEDDHVHFGVA